MSPFFRNPFFEIETVCNTNSDPFSPLNFNTTAATMFSSPVFSSFPQQQQQPQQQYQVYNSFNNFNNGNNSYLANNLGATTGTSTPITITGLTSALQVAAANGDIGRVEEIARLGGINLINNQDEFGVTALHSAVKYGRHNVIHSLLRMGANPNILTLEGESALHLAVASSDEQTVQQLLSCGAFVNIQDDAGDSPLHWAVRESNLRILDLLLNNGAHVNATNEDGETPLHIAASLGEKKLARALVARGAQIDAQDGSGVTPLEEANANEHFDLVKELSAALPSSSFARTRSACEMAVSPVSQNCSFSVMDKSPLPQVEVYNPFRSSVISAGF